MSRSTRIFWALVAVLLAASAYFAVGAERQRAAAHDDAASEARP